MDIKKQLKKLQILPDKHKKVILWTIVVILAGAMLFFWFNLAKKRVSDLGNVIGKIELPQVETPAEDTETEKNETADWKTYTNDEYGFEIKYPNDWYITEYSVDRPPKDWSATDYSFKKQITISKNKDPNYPVFPILSVEFSTDGNYPEIITIEKKRLDEWKNFPQLEGKVNDVIFSGMPAKEFLYYYPIGTDSIEQTIIVSKNSSTIKIQSYKNSALDPILSTFKFLE